MLPTPEKYFIRGHFATENRALFDNEPAEFLKGSHEKVPHQHLSIDSLAATILTTFAPEDPLTLKRMGLFAFTGQLK